jgi:orotidine-5'-phosphate decarboxylase
MDMLRRRWSESGSLVCVGLDPMPELFPDGFGSTPDDVFQFCREIVDATAGYACAFKPQIAHFAALEAEDALKRLVEHVHVQHPGIPVILDSKRGDIGSTARHYASEAFDRFAADAVTVNPYLGRDSLQPFLDRADKGVVILCRTSNPGSGDLQDLVVDGRPLYQCVAEKVAREWNGNGNCALVVGATWPGQLREVRAIVGSMPILVPGIGTQGGDVAAVVAAGITDDGQGLVVSASRSVLYASSEPGRFAEAAGTAAKALRDSINDCRS